MKLKNIFAIGTMALAGLASCNDDFLERLPITDLTEENAFETYGNFKAYMYQCYGLFTDKRIETNMKGNYMESGQSQSDFHAGVMTKREKANNPYAYQTLTNVTKSDNWDFSYIRKVNIMLDHLNSSKMNETDKKHWRSVGYFFHSWWYMELVARYGDVPWVNKTLTESSEEIMDPRMPRVQVADSIVARLEYAIANIGDSSKDGDNAVTADAVRAALSRFLLREGTWAKYHGLNEPWEKYLRKCMEVSQELMNRYPTLYKGNGYNKYLGAGYDEVFTTEDLTGVPGIIMFKQYIEGVLMHRFSDAMHIGMHNVDAPQYTVDMFLMRNGKPINNSTSGFQGGEGKDLWDYYADRDPRLHINFQPPAQAKVSKSILPNVDNVNVFKKWTFWKVGEDLNKKGNFIVDEEYAKKFRTYIDYFGPNIACENGTGDEKIGVKRFPCHNWGGIMSASAPNISGNGLQTDPYIRCLTGYYFWKHYTKWEVSSNGAYQTSDKPIFTVEEALLNYAEAAWEVGEFNQGVADKTINLLRDRVDMAPMVVSEITADFDPMRDKGTAAWTQGYDEKTNYEVDPVLWEIRRERMVELMGQGFSFYDVKRWHKAPWYVNRQPCGLWLPAKKVPYGTGVYTGQFVDYKEINSKGYAPAQNNSVGGGWMFTQAGPLAMGKGWLDTYYLEMVPTYEITMNPNLTQNPGYNELFGLGE